MKSRAIALYLSVFAESRIYWLDEAVTNRGLRVRTNAPDPIRIGTPQLSVRAWARVVLGWVTPWKVLVLQLIKKAK